MKYGKDFPKSVRKTALFEAEERYQKLLSERLNRPCVPIKRSNFGQYDMAVNYVTSVLEEAKSIENVSIFNIDHMAQIEFSGKDAETLLHRVLPANIEKMKIGSCKYTLLLNEKGGVEDDMIVMRMSSDKFIAVINAGHDITGKGEDHGIEKEFISDADTIMKYKKDDEDVTVKDLSDELVKIDIQGRYSYKLVTELYGKSVVKNRYKPEKNMSYFTFNEFEYEGEEYIISRTGYTSRWGWELYVPAKVAVEQFNRITEKALELDGLLVGLGGRDENRISAGNFGLPLNGQEYDPNHTPINSPLFGAAVDMEKDFVGKEAILKELERGTNKKMVAVISEGIVVGCGIYLDGKRLGTVTSSINSPNVSLEKREFIGSKRKSVQGENGTAAIGLAWLCDNPFEVDEDGKDILSFDGKAVRIKVEFYREDKDGKPKGRAVLGYISGDGITPATAPKPLKKIQNL
ncbi:MAG: aminomethyltransferase [Candidatus Cloacimonadota bacterium]|nr:MAG: aminomethyltransferase [Candidatus Cloacimonadota bacterium]